MNKDDYLQYRKVKITIEEFYSTNKGVIRFREPSIGSVYALDMGNEEETRKNLADALCEWLEELIEQIKDGEFRL